MNLIALSPATEFKFTIKFWTNLKDTNDDFSSNQITILKQTLSNKVKYFDNVNVMNSVIKNNDD